MALKSAKKVRNSEVVSKMRAFEYSDLTGFCKKKSGLFVLSLGWHHLYYNFFQYKVNRCIQNETTLECAKKSCKLVQTF